MREITVNKNDSGQRIDKFLIKLLFGASNSMIYKWLRKKRVKVNGKKPDISYMLCEGDCLELYINDEFFESPQKRVPEFFNKELPLTVVYEDSNIRQELRHTVRTPDFWKGFGHIFTERVNIRPKVRTPLPLHCATELTETPQGLL